MTNEERIDEAFQKHGLDLYRTWPPIGPWPRWWHVRQWMLMRRINKALVAEGLPPFNAERFQSRKQEWDEEQEHQGRDDVGGFALRLWCRSLGLIHRCAWSNAFVDPVTGERSDQGSAHSRLRFAAAAAKQGVTL